MGLFTRNVPILIDGTQYLKYVGGGYESKPIRIHSYIPEDAASNQEAIKKLGLQKVINYAGKDHTIDGTITASDPLTGRSFYISFLYKPKREKFAVPKRYKAAGPSSSERAAAAGMKVLKAVDTGFTYLMEGKPKKKTSSSRKSTGTKKKSTGTRKTTSAGTKRKSSTKSGTRKSCGTKRKTTARRRS